MLDDEGDELLQVQDLTFQICCLDPDNVKEVSMLEPLNAPGGHVSDQRVFEEEFPDLAEEDDSDLNEA